MNGEYFALEKPAGIARYSIELLKELDKIVFPGEIEVIAPRCVFDSSLFKNIRIIKLGFWRFSKLNRTQMRIWRNVWFPLYCRMNNAYVITTGLTWKHYNKFNIFAIHDCIPELFPSFYTSQRVKELIRMQKRNISYCDFVLTVSSSSKIDIGRIYDIPLEKIKVIPNAWQHFVHVNEDDSIINRLGLRKKEYFFSLGSRQQHKNIKWVAAAARKHSQYKFIVTGSRQGKTDTSFEGDIPENMIFTGYLRDEEIKSLMRYCKAFIQPSLYEGFGIPPMEAMSVGADCIVSKEGSLPEIYKDSVWYIDPYDYDNIDLDRIMSEPKKSNEQVLNEYSWEKSAKILYDIIIDRIDLE